MHHPTVAALQRPGLDVDEKSVSPLLDVGDFLSGLISNLYNWSVSD